MIFMGKFLLILLILASTNTYAAINKWVDSQGQVHYSDQPPPPGKQPITLREDSNTQDSASSGASETKTIAEREAELKKENAKKQAEADKAAQKKAAEAERKASCDSAQENLRAMQSGLRVMTVNANGEKSYMDDKERQQRIDKANQAISDYCK
jgi:hypothetical protein